MPEEFVIGKLLGESVGMELNVITTTVVSAVVSEEEKVFDVVVTEFWIEEKIVLVTFVRVEEVDWVTVGFSAANTEVAGSETAEFIFLNSFSNEEVFKGKVSNSVCMLMRILLIWKRKYKNFYFLRSKEVKFGY
ncbi:hypothetical protein HK099_003032 [Clydaea vesicula]|uniref:Uncharacterized protein n=1 Tax=Clydaea vesicula TaxID=447962 RepID=A0AAD5XZ13_9FUNG|nr:hypothetical protein HK099_003032 [Clydaea vesicula]